MVARRPRSARWCSAIPWKERPPARRPRSASSSTATTCTSGSPAGTARPRRIVATQLGRDADLDVDDWVVIVLDPFYDQRNGFFFFVNPAGARADGQISNNAREPSLEWDGIWDARARITPEGWVAEIVIPFKTLRFKPGQTVWGLNVERQIKRRQEHDRWASPRNDVWITNLAAAGRLGGLEGAQQGRGLDIRPYVSGGEESSDGTAKAGLDVVKSLTPEPDRLAHGQHRLRGDRGRRPSGQPDPLRALLPGEAHVLPRGGGRLRRGRPLGCRRRRARPRPPPVPQPDDRAVPRPGDPDPRRRRSSTGDSRASTSASSTWRRAARP